MAKIDTAALKCHARAGWNGARRMRHVRAFVPPRSVEGVEAERPVDPFVAAERAARHLHLGDVIELAVAAIRLAAAVSENVIREAEARSDLILVVELDGVFSGGRNAWVGVRRNPLRLRTNAEGQRQTVIGHCPTVLQEEAGVLARNPAVSLNEVNGRGPILAARRAEPA